MPLPTLVIHVVPLQVKLIGTTISITCDDPRARIVDGELVFELNEPNPKDPEAQHRVSFVVEDPADTSKYDYYLNLSSAPPLERLVAWKRSGTTSRSPEFLPGAKIEVVAVLYGVPQPTSPASSAVQVAHNRRRVILTDPGAPLDI